MPVPQTLRSQIEAVLLGEEEIQQRVAELGRQITRDYHRDEILLLSVLRGSVIFTADLMRVVQRPLVLDFISISSYGDATETSGVVRILKDVEEPIRGRHVLVVEDIVDTGLTLSYLLENLRLRQPASLKVCSLLDKPARRRVEVPIDYLGFSIEDRFVVGYGLDYQDRFRHLPCVAVLKEVP